MEQLIERVTSASLWKWKWWSEVAAVGEVAGVKK
jgi:hypothetical protein